MKNLRNFLLLSLLLLGMACHKDKGNYDYTEIPAIDIESNPERINLKVGAKDTLWTKGAQGDHNLQDTARYAYTWWILDNFIKTRLPQIRTAFITAGDIEKTGLRGEINFLVEVTDKISGFKSNGLALVLYLHPLTEGWMLLCEKEGHSDLNFLSYDYDGYELYRGIADTLGITALLSGKPVSSANAQLNGLYGSWYDYSIAISTENKYLVLNWLNFSYRKEPSETITTALKPSSTTPLYLSGVDGLIQTPTDFYAMYVDQIPPFGKFDHAVPFNDYNLIDPDKGVLPDPPDKFQASPVIIPYYDRSGGAFKNMVYDLDRSRFVIPPYYFAGNFISRYADVSFNPAFDLTGFEPRCGAAMDYAGVMQFNMVMKNEADEYLFLSFLQNGLLQKKEIINEPRLGMAEHMVMDMRSGYVIFNNQNQLFAYDYTTKKTRQLLDFGTEKISLLKFEHSLDMAQDVYTVGRKAAYQALVKQLVVCTYDQGRPDNSGTFHLYDIPIGHQPLIEKTQIAGLPRIQSATFIKLN
ncbi:MULTISPECIES: PKD-like family lipoprotein [unclassified Sphingobacterium]|uniref:PKD-like family lipoprotein n=1 Tax=unclassified Sphingobacterium TaxID=2609468 RepID=UPI001050B3F9|nr:MULTISPECIES: PKD-like family lipoprotein [unclassified Sphingobacterium]MCS3556159.1 hypothetical protein [Sphingobacterium sp. JUb21]TCR08535.1 PKD family protein [Sphingobacterium sp. JUb20]